MNLTDHILYDNNEPGTAECTKHCVCSRLFYSIENRHEDYGENPSSIIEKCRIMVYNVYSFQVYTNHVAIAKEKNDSDRFISFCCGRGWLRLC
jgi:hypothetical protein